MQAVRTDLPWGLQHDDACIPSAFIMRKLPDGRGIWGIFLGCKDQTAAEIARSRINIPRISAIQ